MPRTIADLMAETLNVAGVKRIYGVVGDSLNGFTDSLRKQKKIDWIHMRHEEAAAFAAGAEAHLTGELAVCAGSCGPGNLHLINGLFDCQRSRVPVVAIAAHIPSAEIGGSNRRGGPLGWSAAAVAGEMVSVWTAWDSFSTTSRLPCNAACSATFSRSNWRGSINCRPLIRSMTTSVTSKWIGTWRCCAIRNASSPSQLPAQCAPLCQVAVGQQDDADASGQVALDLPQQASHRLGHRPGQPVEREARIRVLKRENPHFPVPGLQG